ncbi:MAG: hypothetical protein AAF739_01395 [Pseudomonadota bacterium]
MSIQVEDCKPYLSGVLFHTGTAITAPRLLKIHDAIFELIASLEDTDRAARELQAVANKVGQSGSMHWACIHYREKRKPAWYSDYTLLDSSNHIIILSGAGKYLIANFSDPSLRNKIVGMISKTKDQPLASLRRFERKDVVASLVDDEVRTLWMTGTHRQSAVKADSKTLSGIELEAAIDPLGDQTYYFSSIRSTVNSETFPKAVIGSSPAHGRFWISPSENWESFLERTEALLGHVSASLLDPSEKRVLPSLAQPSTDLSAVSEPYGLSLVVPEAQFPDAVRDGDQDWLQNFADSARFVLATRDGTPDFEATVWWHEDRLGTIEYRFEITSTGKTRLVTDVLQWTDDTEELSSLKQLCQSRDLLTIYFDTGHTFSRGSFYETAFRDPNYDGWKWVNCANCDVSKEKPIRKNSNNKSVFDPSKIGETGEDSLFSLVVHHWPNMETLGEPKGWLLCDDGSMESADFIHLEPTASTPQLTLIHVKGSGSDAASRQISVADYEVVVGQAIKNLRHLDRNELHEKLSASDGGSVAKAVWFEGNKANRDDFLEALKTMGSNLSVEVCIFQPSVRKDEWTTVKDRINQGLPDNQRAKRMRQLDALLQGASANCFALGAKLICLGEA